MFILLGVRNQIENALIDGMQSTIVDELTVKFFNKKIALCIDWIKSETKFFISQMQIFQIEMSRYGLQWKIFYSKKHHLLEKSFL